MAAVLLEQCVILVELKIFIMLTASRNRANLVRLSACKELPQLSP
jgi:hypothetical protein